MESADSRPVPVVPGQGLPEASQHSGTLLPESKAS